MGWCIDVPLRNPKSRHAPRERGLRLPALLISTFSIFLSIALRSEW